MKKNDFLYAFILISLTIIGCNNDDETIAAPQNQSPKDFLVEVSQTTTNSALLKWSEAIDPDGDPVTYTVILEGNEIVTSITKTEYLLKELLPKTKYTGSVIALDGKNGESKNEFTVTTNEIVDTGITTAWQKSLGGSSDDDGYVVIQTNDGGYLIGGTSESTDGNVTSNNGQKDCWVVKLDESGNIIWNVNFGGSGNETIHDLKQTTDGGYIVGAFSSSTDQDVSGNNGMRDFWIVKLDVSGNISWETNVGGNKDDILEAIIETSTGEYVAVGFTSSDQFDVNGQSDAWIVKLDQLGNVSWETNLGGPQRDLAFAIDQTTDQGYIIAGHTETGDNKRDIWIAKLNDEGGLDWEKTYSGSENEEATSVQQTIDGGYIVAGYSMSSDGDFLENNGGRDGVLIKTNNAGDMQWKKNIGGSGSDGINDIKETTDGGYIAVGSSNSSDLDVQENNGAFDFLILRLQSNGEIIWQKNLGGEGNDYAFSIEQTLDDGFITAGTISNIMGVGEGTVTDFNYWVLKLE
ncbi:hypothetical protein AWE51_08215 [Aquimarina aggregata]|uniref:Fibronectin type-III domain-containing protein n=1 Tax=Aquimarina aggregata TaxID=1642818 RepID=A0A162Z8H6_9FLAO|nr:fibronectin type III domain-containing protein [Aquimarina aggregata]KZS39625.1 hypothetical protein AWE51_08215 [Aquimarina aggregata]